MQTQAVQEWTEAVWMLCGRKDAETLWVAGSHVSSAATGDSGTLKRDGTTSLGS